MALAAKQGIITGNGRSESGFRPAVKRNAPTLNSGVDSEPEVKTDSAWRGFCFAVIPAILFWVGFYAAIN